MNTKYKDKNPIKDHKSSSKIFDLTNNCAMKIPKSCMESENEDNQKFEKFMCESDEEMSGFSSHESDDETGNNSGEFGVI
jgi:hypothetical protein